MEVVTIERVLAQALGGDDAPADRARHIPTGFRGLDDVLASGLRTGQTTIVASRPGDGASTFALRLARSTALHQRPPACLAAPDTRARDRDTPACRRDQNAFALPSQRRAHAAGPRTPMGTPGTAEQVADHHQRREPYSLGPRGLLGLSRLYDRAPGRASGRGGRRRPSRPRPPPCLGRDEFAGPGVPLPSGARHRRSLAGLSRPRVLEDLRDHDAISYLVDLNLMCHRTEAGEATAEIVKHRYGPQPRSLSGCSTTTAASPTCPPDRAVGTRTRGLFLSSLVDVDAEPGQFSLLTATSPTPALPIPTDALIGWRS